MKGFLEGFWEHTPDSQNFSRKQSSLMLKAISISSLIKRDLPLTSRVHSVFQRSFNMLDDRGRMLTVANKSMGNLPYGVLVELSPGFDFSRTGLAQGEEVHISALSIAIKQARLKIDISRAATWEVDSCSRPPRPDPQAIAANIELALLVAESRFEEKGLIPFFSNFQGLFDDPPKPPEPGTKLTEYAFEPLTKVISGIRRKDQNEVLKGAVRLIGLGIGLTPSGDDILIGCMGTLVLLKGWIEPADWIRCLTSGLRPLIKGKTTLVAETYLNYALEGVVSEALADFIMAVLGQDRELVQKSSQRLMSFGAASGREICLGALLALNVIRENMTMFA